MIMKLAILFLLGTISGSKSISCPPEKLIYPCDCFAIYSSLTFSCDFNPENYKIFLNVHSQIAESMNKTTGNVLKLKNIRFSRLSNELLAGMRLISLTIDDSDISEIEKDAFKDSFNSFFSIYFYHTKLTKIPFEALSNMKTLSFLELTNSLVSSIAKSEIDQLPSSLTYVSLSANRISKIESNAFDKLVNLKYLHLDYNLLTSFTITILPKLAYLGLNYNRLTDIGNINWKKISKGATINLNNNNITALPNKKTLENMSINAISITLYGNEIICDCGTKWVLKHPAYLPYFKCAAGSGARTSKYFRSLVKDDYSDC